MEIMIGAPVLSREGTKAGEVSVVVLDGRTQAATHLVVRKGWLLPRDIVVALTDVETVAADGVRLRLDERELEQQPDYIEAHYVAPEEGDPVPAGYPAQGAPGSFMYSPMLPRAGVGWSLPYGYMPPMEVETERNVPEGSVTLSEGMDVWTGDEQAGTLAGVRLHPRTEQVSHIVVSRGWLFEEERLVPRAAIAAVDDRGVHLRVSPDELRTLPRVDPV